MLCHVVTLPHCCRRSWRWRYLMKVRLKIASGSAAGSHARSSAAAEAVLEKPETDSVLRRFTVFVVCFGVPAVAVLSLKCERKESVLLVFSEWLAAASVAGLFAF